MVPKCYEGDLSSIIIPEGLINDRLKQLAHEIHSIVGDQVSCGGLLYNFILLKQTV